MEPITISALINATLDQVWTSYTEPQHIMQWNQASEDWHCPAASNDLRVGGKMVSTMAAKDGSFQFEFGGTYDEVTPKSFLHYHLDDGRHVRVSFKQKNDHVVVTTVFDPEDINPLDMQEAGWQAILDSFKKHAETL